MLFFGAFHYIIFISTNCLFVLEVSETKLALKLRSVVRVPSMTRCVFICIFFKACEIRVNQLKINKSLLIENAALVETLDRIKKLPFDTPPPKKNFRILSLILNCSKMPEIKLLLHGF